MFAPPKHRRVDCSRKSDSGAEGLGSNSCPDADTVGDGGRLTPCQEALINEQQREESGSVAIVIL